MEDEDISREEKSKSRSVSFSNITSVHFFDRDDDYQTPPEKQSSTPHEQVKEFFGPASLWHIGSESAARSPPEHDITLDSAEFSQHFSKLASLETENFRQVSSTPTTESSQEDFMILTNNSKLNAQPGSVQGAVDDDNAEDMDITGRSPSEYNCATISPSLNSLIAETMRQVQFNKKPGYTKSGLRKISGVMGQANLFTSGFIVDKSEKTNPRYSIDLRNEQFTSQGTNGDHEMLSSSSSPQALKDVDMRISRVCNEMVASGPVQCAMSVSPKIHDLILLPSDHLSLHECRNSEISSRVICPEKGENQQFSSERRDRGTVKNLIPLPSSSSGCMAIENLNHWQDGYSDKPIGGILKVKKKHTDEFLTSVEPITAIDKASLNGADEFEVNCKYHLTFCDELPKCLKNKNTDPLFIVELKDKAKNTALHTETCPDSNLSVACKSTGRTRSARNCGDLTVALCASLGNGNISLKRSILAPISLNVEETRPLCTTTEAKTPRKGHELKDKVQKRMTMTTDLMNKMLALSPLKANFSCEQQKLSGQLTPCFHQRDDGKYISETDFSRLRPDSKGNYGKHNWIQTLELHEGNPSIYISEDDGLSCESNLKENNIMEIPLEFMSKCSVHSAEKETAAGTSMDVQKHTEIASAKLIEGLSLPLISKPRTLQQCLSFIYAKRPQICLLEDTVEQLQRDIANIRSLSNMKNQLIDEKNPLAVKNKSHLPESFRMGHIKWLQQVLVYEKFKSQLLLAKEEELKKIVENLQFGLQAVDNLKVRALCLDKKALLEKRTSWSVKKHAIDDERNDLIQSIKVEIEKQIKSFASKKADYEGQLKEVQKENLVLCEKIIIMKQELNVLDSKIRDLCDFYSTVSSKNHIPKEEIIRALEYDVKSKTKKLFFLQDMLLWKLKVIKSKSKEHFIELNYLNIISQRFWIDGNGNFSKASISYSISYETIERGFPFMSASVAFDAVFASKQSLKSVDVDALWHTVQVAETRFASHTIVLRRLVRVKEALCQMVISNKWGGWKQVDTEKAKIVKDLIFSDDFWNRVEYALELTEPLMSMLRYADTDEPCLGNIYDAMDSMLERMKSETSFLFGSLIVVLQEVQLCRAKFTNLSFACFHCLDGSELHLQLTFLKYTSGLKVVATLDMKDLKCGVYPCDVRPFQLELDQNGHPPKFTLAAEEIEESIKSSSSGFSRLTRLCECISNLIESKECSP